MGVLPESAYVRVTLCILGGCMAHHNGDARHCTRARGELTAPDGYSTSTHVGVMSCGPSLRVRLRPDADALQHARANAEPDDTLADAQACATADNT